MHFHLPKPLHGWRQFAGEVGIIVIGVLIALSAEQVVEAWHWKTEVTTERQSLRQEATDSINAIGVRERQQSCVDSRLREILKVLQLHSRGEPFRIVGSIGLPTRQTGTRGTWQIALAGQALSHMSHDEKLKFSTAFGAFDIWDRATSDETDTWYGLAPLNHAELMTDADWVAIRAAYARAAIRNDRMRLLAPFIFKTVSSQLRLPKTQASPVSGFEKLTWEICKPMLPKA